MFKMIIAIVLLISCISGCGCGSKPDVRDRNSPIGYPNVTKYGTSNYYYVVDENTGVVYLEYDSGVYQGGLSVMFDENGEVLTFDKLKERYKLYGNE